MINTSRVGVMNGEKERIYVSRIISCYYDYWNCIRNFNSGSRQFTEKSKCQKIRLFFNDCERGNRLICGAIWQKYWHEQ